MITAKIVLQSKKELALSSSKHIAIDLGEGSQNFIDFYMEKDQSGCYVLNLLGVNGEPIGNSQVVVSYMVRGVEEEEKVTLKTN